MAKTIKFWQEMLKALSINPNDKFLIGKNDSGEAQYCDANQLANYLNLEKAGYIPYTNNPVVSVAYTFVGAGNYGSIIVASNKFAVLGWRNGSWNKDNEFDLVVPIVLDSYGDSIISAISQKKATETRNLLNQSINDLNSKISLNASNILSKESLSNKSQSVDNNNTKYPSNFAVKTYVDNKLNVVTNTIFGGAINDTKDLREVPKNNIWYFASPGTYKTSSGDIIADAEISILAYSKTSGWEIEGIYINISKDFIVYDNIESLRSMSNYEKELIINGLVKGVTLLGYYEKEDTPAPIEYYLSNTSTPDDGGSIIDVGGIKLEHKFEDLVYLEYFGSRDNSLDTSQEVQNCFDYVGDNHLTLMGSEGKTYIIDNVIVSDKSKFKVDCKCILKRMDNMPPYPEGTPMTQATSTLRFDNCKDVYVINLHLDGNAQNNNCLTTGTTTGSYNWGGYLQEFRHSLYLNDCKNMTFDYFCADNPSGDGVYTKGASAKNIHFRKIAGKSLDINGNIYPIGRNLLSIIEGKNYIVDDIYSDGIGHSTMPSGLDIEPNSGQIVDTVNVVNVYNRSLGMSGLGITTKYGGGNNIKNINIVNAYIDNQKFIQGATVRSVVITGATNVNIDNIFIKGSPSSYCLHVGIAGEAQPVYNLNINNFKADTCLYGTMLDNLHDSFIKADVVNCYENMYRLYNMENVNLDITGEFSPNIDNSGTKNFCVYLNTASTGVMTNCTFSGDISKLKVKGGHRAISANNSTVDQIFNCSIDNLNLDGWVSGTKIVGANLRIRQINITKIINRGATTSLPIPEVHGHRFWDETSFSWKYWNSSRWRPFTTNDYTLNINPLATLPNEAGVHVWENNCTSGECTLNIPLSGRYTIGTSFMLKNNQPQNVRLTGDVGVTIQSSSTHNAVLLSKVNDVLFLYCVAVNNWRYVVIPAVVNATTIVKGVVNQAVSLPTTATNEEIITALKNAGLMAT